jgi:TRAP-type C4-dicarboxylate transport system permease small subunit
MSAQQAYFENYEYIATNSFSLVFTSITILYITRKPDVKRVLSWFVNLLIVMAFGYVSRITFQAFNIYYFDRLAVEDDNIKNVTIWLPFTFGWGTALVPIGFTCFAFRYFEVTSLSQVAVNHSSNHKEISD